MMDKLGQKVLVSVGLGALVFLGLSVYSDLGRLAEAFGRFRVGIVPAALGLALLNYGVRFGRWHAYLNLLKLPLPRKDSLVVFLAGLVMSVTPGKAGELLKAYFVHDRLGTPISRCVPAILAERLTDFISLIFLAFLGIFSFHQSVFWLVLAVGILGGFVLFVGQPRAVGFCLRLLRLLPLLRRLAGPLERAYAGVKLLAAPVHLLWATALGAAAWFAECLGFYLVLAGFGAQVGVVASTFIYSFATLFGAVTLLPGGLGPTEGSMSGLLIMEGVALPDAVAATFVIRVCTLWFAVALGGLVILKYRREFAARGANGGEPSGGQSVRSAGAVPTRGDGMTR